MTQQSGGTSEGLHIFRLLKQAGMPLGGGDQQTSDDCVTKGEKEWFHRKVSILSRLVYYWVHKSYILKQENLPMEWDNSNGVFVVITENKREALVLRQSVLGKWNGFGITQQIGRFIKMEMFFWWKSRFWTKGSVVYFLNTLGKQITLQ